MSKGPDANKILSGILLAALVASLSGFISGKLVSPSFPEQKGLAVTVADAAPAGGEAAKPAGPEPIDALMASANIENGQKLTKACAACHTFDKGGPNRVGPNLHGIAGAKQASHAGFAYSEALKGKGGTWTEAELNAWLYDPKTYAKGNKMAFAGIKKTQDRADVIAYLKSLK